MRVTLHIEGGERGDGERVDVDLSQPRDISIRLNLHDPAAQPNAFGLPRASATPFEAGDFVGATARGGSANCSDVTLNPHGNGTHTECVGHIVDDPIPVADILEDTLVLALVVSVPLRGLEESGEGYDATSAPDDRVVTAADLRRAISLAEAAAEAAAEDLAPDALVVRTLPNDEAKRRRDWSGDDPPYLTSDAMLLIRQAGYKHLLVDLPSVDRADDGGLLPNHHVFWDVPLGTSRVVNVPSPHTITEMIYVPDGIADGLWALTIQIPDFLLDAAPSRPRLFAILDVAP